MWPACNPGDLIWLLSPVTSDMVHASLVLYMPSFFVGGRQGQRANSNFTAQGEPSYPSPDFSFKDLPLLLLADSERWSTDMEMMYWRSPHTNRENQWDGLPFPQPGSRSFWTENNQNLFVNGWLIFSKVRRLDEMIMALGKTGRELVLTCWVLRSWR